MAQVRCNYRELVIMKPGRLLMSKRIAFFKDMLYY